MSHFLHIKFNIFFSLPIRVFSETVKLFLKTFFPGWSFQSFSSRRWEKSSLKNAVLSKELQAFYGHIMLRVNHVPFVTQI